MSQTSPFANWLSLSSRKFAFAPILFFTFHLVISHVFNLYDLYPSTDIPMHFFGGFCIAFFINGSYQTAEKLKMLGKPNVLLRIITVFALTSTVTIFWEFAEFSMDTLFHTYLQLSLADTMKDMFLGMLGGCLFLFFNKQKHD